MISKISAAALLAVIAFAPPSAQASGAAPWCAVINLGIGDVHWDCHYTSFEACYPNVLAGNRGFCNENPYYTGASRPARAYRRHHANRG
jgi:hypothetical protein